MKKELKYHPGQVVIIRPDLVHGDTFGSELFISEMMKYPTVTIKSFSDTEMHYETAYTVVENRFYYSDEMILRALDKNELDDANVSTLKLILNQGNDLISKIEHYLHAYEDNQPLRPMITAIRNHFDLLDDSLKKVKNE